MLYLTLQKYCQMRQEDIAIPNIQEEQLTFGNFSQGATANKKTTKNTKARMLFTGILVAAVIILVFVAVKYYLIASPQENTAFSQPIHNSSFTQQYQPQNSFANPSISNAKTNDSDTHQISLSSPPNEQLISRSDNLQPIVTNEDFAKAYGQNIANDHHLLTFLKKRIKSFQNLLSTLKKSPPELLSKQIESSNSSITNQQFLNAVELITYAPLVLNNSQRIEKALAKEEQYYNNKYSIQSYKEFPFCVVVPTYKNSIKYRYFLNLYTILQQDYSNYHVIIIDDASDDHTADKIDKEILSNPLAKQRVTFIRNSQRKYHMANIHFAIHKHCRSGQILAIVDGDDELVGRKVFKLINAVYHRTKAFSLYTSHIESKKDISLQIGISKPYPEQVIRNNSFRTVKHFYSHLKTTWVDLFLEIREESLKTKQGKWYNNAVDNAIFLSIFQLSCGRVAYLPEITYKYNTFTGNSVANMEYGFRKATADEIRNKQQYSCINQTGPKVYEKLLSYFQ